MIIFSLQPENVFKLYSEYGMDYDIVLQNIAINVLTFRVRIHFTTLPNIKLNFRQLNIQLINSLWIEDQLKTTLLNI